MHSIRKLESYLYAKLHFIFTLIDPEMQTYMIGLWRTTIVCRGSIAELFIAVHSQFMTCSVAMQKQNGNIPSVGTADEERDSHFTCIYHG